jgi:hypothetical protein
VKDDKDPPSHQFAKAAQESLRQLFQQRAEIASRIGTLKRTIMGLAKVFGEDLLNDELSELVDRKGTRWQLKCADACRTILMHGDCALSAQEVFELVQQRIPLALLHHKNALASVTANLNRLVKSGEARTLRREDGLRVWRWAWDGTENQPEDESAEMRLRGEN